MCVCVSECLRVIHTRERDCDEEKEKEKEKERERARAVVRAERKTVCV